MARRPVLDLDAEKTVSFDTKGQEFSGFYLGFKTVRNDLSKDGISKLHIFQTEEGNVGIWGTKKLNDKLQGILDKTQRTQQAYMTFVVYGGKIKLTGGRTQHVFDVDVDEEISLELGTVANAATAPAAQAVSAANEASNDIEDADEDFAEEVEEPAPVRQALSRGTPKTFTQDHKSKVASMLAKKS